MGDCMHAASALSVANGRTPSNSYLYLFIGDLSIKTREEQS